MSRSWNQIITNAGDPNPGAAILRLARMAAAMHRAQMAGETPLEDTRVDGSTHEALVPRPPRTDHKEVIR